MEGAAGWVKIMRTNSSPNSLLSETKHTSASLRRIVGYWNTHCIMSLEAGENVPNVVFQMTLRKQIDSIHLLHRKLDYFYI